mgnify:CR=1 FL=1
MSATVKYGLNKLARLKADREKKLVEDNQPMPLNPRFPYDILPFPADIFGITEYSDAPPEETRPTS